MYCKCYLRQGVLIMNGKYALITGASGGIGQAIALRLASEGWNLYLHYNRNLSGINSLLDQLKSYQIQVKTIQADLSKDGGHQVIVDEINQIDTIILNSGDSHFGLITDISDDRAKRMVSLHITSPFLLTKGLIPKLIQKKAGSIIAITSIWGEVGASCEVLYSMVKGGQNSFVKALAKELAPSGIRVNAVSPGVISTPMLDRFHPEELKELEEEIPMGRLGLPTDISGVISFVLSEDSNYITGQIISVNGGWNT